MSAITAFSHVLPFLSCTHCNAPLDTEEWTPEFILGDTAACLSCRKTFRIWESLISGMSWPFPSHSMTAVGAFTQMIDIKMEPDKIISLNFDECHIPAASRILGISYNPQGGNLMAVELHGNSPVRHGQARQIALHPVHLWKDSAPEITRLVISVSWVPIGDDQAWINIVDAYESFQHGQLSGVIIPASTAIELSLIRSLKPVFERLLAGKNMSTLGRFLQKKSDNLQVLLPTFAALAGMPPLPDFVSGELSKLAKIRNDIAHEGAPKSPLDRESTACMLTGAFYAFTYIRWFASDYAKLLVPTGVGDGPPTAPA